MPEPCHLVPAILLAGLAASSIATAVDPFTVVLIPDTQHYSDSSSNIIHFINQTQWVMDNRVAKNIALVSHVGDVVQNGSNLTEWNRADGAMDTLDTNPDQTYGVVLGNHDHNGGLAADNDATNYISFFGAARYVGKLWYGGDSPDGRNHYHRFSAGGREYLHLIIEYHGASADNSNSAEVITWAQGVLDANPGIPTILSTHEYLNTGGGRSTYGNDIFNAIVKGNPQVFMVLCGHWHGEAHSIAQNDAGQDVFQILADFQERANGGDGWLSLIEFDEDNSTINVTTYSPSLVQWETDANSQYSFAMDFDARLGTPGTGPRLWSPSATAITDVGATVQCRLLNANADDVTVVWALADQGETTVGTWTAAPGGGSHSFGAANQDDVLSRVLTGLNGDTLHSYRFLATAGADSDWSAAVAFATGLGGSPAPADLAGVPGTVVSGTKVELTWTDGYAHETGFLIRRSTDPGFATHDEFSSGANQTSYSDDTTDPNTIYYYRIAAVGGSGTGPFSANIEVTTGNPGSVPVAGLMGHWKFDEGAGTTAADSSLYVHDADQVNGDGSWTTGKAGGAYNQPRFTLDATESDVLNLAGTGTVTLSAWLTVHNTAQYGGIAGFEGTGTTGDIYSLKMDNADRINWTVLPSHGPIVSSDTLANYAAATGDGWVHVVGVFEQGVGSTLYVNGSVAGTGAAGSPIPDKTPPSLFRIGTYYNSSSYEFNGAIDDVQIYNTALSAADVAFLHNNPGNPLPGPSTTFNDWIGGFGLDPADQDFGDDPDHDNLPNGLEAWFGTHPGQFNAGLADLATDSTTTTFSHPQNVTPPSDLTGFYEWSPDLAAWYAGDGVEGPADGPTVTIAATTVGTTTTTTATATASEALDRLFLRVGVMQN